MKGPSPQEVTGKYLVVWEKVGTDWKLSADGTTGSRHLMLSAFRDPKSPDAKVRIWCVFFRTFTLRSA